MHTLFFCIDHVSLFQKAHIPLFPCAELPRAGPQDAMPGPFRPYGQLQVERAQMAGGGSGLSSLLLGDWAPLQSHPALGLVLKERTYCSLCP